VTLSKRPPLRIVPPESGCTIPVEFLVCLCMCVCVCSTLISPFRRIRYGEQRQRGSEGKRVRKRAHPAAYTASPLSQYPYTMTVTRRLRQDHAHILVVELREPRGVSAREALCQVQRKPNVSTSPRHTCLYTCCSVRAIAADEQDPGLLLMAVHDLVLT